MCSHTKQICYSVWVCGIFLGFLRSNICRSNQRTEGKDASEAIRSVVAATLPNIQKSTSVFTVPVLWHH
uniref:Uncharacterized protein n=1 Tax=Sander lucioperca TaxID=283035 RepID=A0A8D0A951_SANLU